MSQKSYDLEQYEPRLKDASVLLAASNSCELVTQTTTMVHMEQHLTLQVGIGVTKTQELRERRCRAGTESFKRYP